MSLEDKEQMQKYFQKISQDLDSDIFVFTSAIENESVDYLITKIRDLQERKSNITLILTTRGGDGDAAFRMARFLKRKYNHLILFIISSCKSAGTFLAIAADEIVMSDFGELGPLDVQVNKEGELRYESGLNIKQYLQVIREEAPRIFDKLLDENFKSGMVDLVPFKTLGDIAARITVDLLKPISSHIEPGRLGELDRKIQIAREYGERLNKNRRETTKKLILDYPSHGFVIDYDEANKLFGDCVRRPTKAESTLEQYLEKYMFDDDSFFWRECKPDQFIGTLEELLEETSKTEKDSSESYSSSDNPT